METTPKPNPDPNDPNPFPKPKPVPAATVIDAAKTYGVQLHLPPTVDGVKLMIALAMNESSLGINVGPRYEKAYDLNGKVWQSSHRQQELVSKYNDAAACSYGPWQMMFINFSDGVTPDQLKDFNVCAKEFVRFFNSYVIKIRKASTLSEIGQVWNGGHVFTEIPPIVASYVKKLEANYELAAAHLS